MLTTGLCGTITTFSTWNFECSKIFMLQWDLSWGNALGSYNGGRTLEWLVCIWTGLAVPLGALHFGQHLALLSPYSNTRFEASSTTQIVQQPTGEWGLIILYCGISLIVLVVPSELKWPQLAYTCIFGALGAFFRLKLSTLNPRFQICVKQCLDILIYLG
jgi:fluoride ion exporter CrcB/FEX